MRNSLKIFVCLFSVSLMTFAGGCYQRTIAPEIEFDQAQVDLIDSEIKKLDWEL
jgi:hypothetical protein